MDVLVRRASSTDVERIAVLNADVQRLHVLARPDHFNDVSAEYIATYLEALLSEDSTSVWVAERSGNVVAYAVVRVRATEFGSHIRARTWWEVDQFGVDRAQRRSGIARALIERIATEARATGAAALELTCWDFNDDAVRAFTSLGFSRKLVRLEMPLGEDRRGL